MEKQKGFTLIELMVTLVVLSILLVWAIPSFERLIEKRRLIGAGEIVYQHLVNARAMAVKRSKPIVVDFYANANTWSAGMTDDPDGCDSQSGSADPCTVEYDNDTETDEPPFPLRVDNGDLTIATMSGLDADDNFSTFPVFLGAPGACTTAQGRETCFEPVRGLARRGRIVLSSDNYELRVQVTRLGMVRICSPNNAKNVSGYPTCIWSG